MKRLSLILVFLVSSLFAQGDRFYDFAKVTYSQPIYDYVYDRGNPHRECREVRKKVRDYDDGYYSNSNYNDSLGVDTLVGVASGAILGSQIGKGNGRVAAQIVGGLLGAKVAHEIRNNYKPSSRYNDNYRDDRYVTTTECYNTYDKVKRKVISGYKNYFVYNGTEHFKITDRPIRKVRITHTINY
ncbi:MAG: glycine zipper 2TM domain-containing protein [Halarcobacter sp.]